MGVFKFYTIICRYCLQWYKVAPNRVNMQWWDRVMAPLKELESIATGQSSVNIDNATINPTTGDKQLIGSGNHSHLNQISYSSNRTSLEDMELETRALTEPLPTNQLVHMIPSVYLNITCILLGYSIECVLCYLM